MSAASLVTFASGVSCFRVTVPRLTAAQSRNSLIPNSGQKPFREDRSSKSKPPTITQEPAAWNGVSPPCQTSDRYFFCLFKFVLQFLRDRCFSSVPLLNSIACYAKQLRRQMCLFSRTAPISSSLLLLRRDSGQKKNPKCENHFPTLCSFSVNQNKGDSSVSAMGQYQTWSSQA